MNRSLQQTFFHHPPGIQPAVTVFGVVRICLVKYQCKAELTDDQSFQTWVVAQVHASCNLYECLGLTVAKGLERLLLPTCRTEDAPRGEQLSEASPRFLRAWEALRAAVDNGRCLCDDVQNMRLNSSLFTRYTGTSSHKVVYGNYRGVIQDGVIAPCVSGPQPTMLA